MKVVLENVRLAFSHPGLFVASAVNGEGQPKFSCSLILQPGHAGIKAIEDAALKCAQEKWGAKAAQMIAAMKAQDKHPLHNGDTKTSYDGFPGNFFVSARSVKKPLVIDRDRTPLDQSSPRLYPGAYVNAIIDLWAQDNQFGKRINAQIQGVQYFADGDSFGGGGTVASQDEFADLGVGEEVADPLA